MRLYEIANEYQSILEQTFDQDTGEVNETALAKLEALQVDMQQKTIAVASYIKNLDAERKAIEEAKQAMADREKRLEKRVSYLTAYLQSNMERCAINEITSPYFVVKLKKCPLSTDILDENALPDEYKRRKEVITVDKLKIKEELLAGVVIPGAALKQNYRLEIK